MGDILVSCIMPTGNRQHLIGLAIDSFFKQTVTETELIIVDDGRVPTAVPDDPRIRFFHVDRQSIGAKLNFACTRAQADIICRWDDDDWYSADRIAKQLEELAKPGIQVTGFHGVNYYDMKTGQIWPITLSMPQPHAMGTSLFFRKSYWEKNRFELVSIAEDTKFSNRASAQKVLSSISGWPYVVARKHNLNTSKFAAVNPNSNTNTVPQAFLDMEAEKIAEGKKIVRPPDTAIRVRAGGPYAKDGLTVDWHVRRKC